MIGKYVLLLRYGRTFEALVLNTFFKDNGELDFIEYEEVEDPHSFGMCSQKDIIDVLEEL